MRNKRVPEIRFAEFTQEWKERKLSDVSERVRGNDGRMDLPTLTISASLGWMDQRDRFSANIAGKEQEKYTLLRKGQLSYNHGNSQLAKYGVVFKLKTYEEALVPRVYHSFETTKEASSSFIEYMFATKKPDQELAKLVSSGARMDGLLNINFDEFMGIKINIPRIEEQTKISTFLELLDNNIALQEKELNTLKKIKQGFLQKMLPNDNEVVPEIRFSGFTGEWNQYKIGEITDSYSGGTPSAGERIYYGGNIPFIRSGEINSETTKLFITEDGLNNSSAKLVEKGDILYALYGATSGEVGLSKISGAINQAILAIKPKYENDSNFITQWFKKQKSQILSTYLQGGQGNLSGSIVKNLIIPIPNDKQEQIQIGNFFKQFDEMIALNQKELTVLQDTKNAFLQKMFV